MSKSFGTLLMLLASFVIGCSRNASDADMNPNSTEMQTPPASTTTPQTGSSGTAMPLPNEGNPTPGAGVTDGTTGVQSGSSNATGTTGTAATSSGATVQEVTPQP